MKKVYLFIFGILISNMTFAQFEIGAGVASIASAATDQYGDIQSNQFTKFQLSADYDFLRNSSGRIAIGSDFIYLGADGAENVAILPGIKLGWDFINLKVNYYTEGEVFYYGLGSRIGFGESKKHGINLALQAATFEGTDAVQVWFNLAYSIRF